MDQVIYSKPCKEDSDCQSNVCEQIHDDNNVPQGRFCVSEKSEYGRVCNSGLDCESGNCIAIKNENDQIIGRRCEPFDSSNQNKNEDIENSFLMQNVDLNENAVLNDQYRQKLFNDSNAGYIARFMVFVVEKIIYIVKAIVNALWGFFIGVITFIGNLFLGKIKGGLIFGLISNKYRQTGTCFSMWLPRTIVAILLPPFGVYLSRGLRGIKYVLICCVLTCFFYFPGLIYAMIVMNNSNIAKGEEEYMRRIKANQRK